MERNVVNLGKTAHKLKREGKLREAEEIYMRVLRMDSDSVYALVGLGDLKRIARHFEDAVKYYERCLEIEKNNWFALAGLGDACRGLGDLEKALKAWYHCLQLRPGDHKTMTRVADGLRKKGNLDDSKEYYFMALAKYPLDPYALMGLGQIAMQQGDDDEALDFFERVAEISDNPVIGLTSAANILRETKSIQKGNCSLRKSTQICSGKFPCLAWKSRLSEGVEAISIGN